MRQVLYAYSHQIDGIEWTNFSFHPVQSNVREIVASLVASGTLERRDEPCYLTRAGPDSLPVNCIRRGVETFSLRRCKLFHRMGNEIDLRLFNHSSRRLLYPTIEENARNWT